MTVIVLPMTAFFAARFGRRNYLTASILIFIIASCFCGTVHSLITLVFWRVRSRQDCHGVASLRPSVKHFRW